MYITDQTYRALGQSPGLTSAAAWQDLISFRPSEALQKTVLGRGFPARWFFHRIEDAFGDVNLDYYPIKVSKLPTINGNPHTATMLMHAIRLNISKLSDSRLISFTPWNSTEAARWFSPNPLGTVLHLNFYRLLTGLPVVNVINNIDDGAVVIGDVTSSYWRVYTIWTDADHGHPVSGVREWGYRPDGNGYIFYTRAADRLTKSVMLPFKGDVYAAQHALWLAHQRAVAMYVNNNGGKADVLPPTANRYDWGLVAGQYHRPTVRWVTP